MQNVESWLENTTKRLKDASISTAELDALILLEDELRIGRAHLLAHPETELSSSQLRRLEANILKRIDHEPLAYIRGKTEFFGREFTVSPATLEPRPETETMIELFFKNAPHQSGTILDIGTGSGCIAITVKLEQPAMKVIATEINDDALEVAKKNASNLGANVIFMGGNLLEPLARSRFEIPLFILCNLPYVPDSWTINGAAMHEPRVAIFGGEDGLDLYRQLFDQINRYHINPDLIFTESLPPQHTELCKIAESAGFIKHASQDFIVVFRKK